MQPEGPLATTKRWLDNAGVFDDLAAAINDLCGGGDDPEGNALQLLDREVRQALETKLDGLAAKITLKAKSSPAVRDRRSTISGFDENDAGLRIIEEAHAKQRKEAAHAGALQLHGASGLPPAMWGISKAQFQEFVKAVKVAHQGGVIINTTPRGKEEYKQAVFDDPKVGPNMHQVNKWVIEEQRRHKTLPGVSYAVGKNLKTGGLRCALFFSHAWDEGIYEFAENALAAWPDDCEGAYICCLSNPQEEAIAKYVMGEVSISNLDRLMATDSGSVAGQSPFEKVLNATPPPKAMIMLANRNTPIHTRLWCVLEAHIARQRRIEMVRIAGRAIDLLVGKDGKDHVLKRLQLELDKSEDAAKEAATLAISKELEAVSPDERDKAKKKSEKHKEEVLKCKVELADAKLQVLLTPSNELIELKKATATEETDRKYIQAMIRPYERKITELIAELIRDNVCGVSSDHGDRDPMARGQDPLGSSSTSTISSTDPAPSHLKRQGSAEKHDVALSKTLSQLLRHDALEQGMKIDQNGWALLDDVLKYINKPKPAGGQYTEKNVRDVVDSSNSILNDAGASFELSRRFELREQKAGQKKPGTQIRAVRKHTMRIIDGPLGPLSLDEQTVKLSRSALLSSLEVLQLGRWMRSSPHATMLDLHERGESRDGPQTDRSDGLRQKLIKMVGCELARFSDDEQKEDTLKQLKSVWLDATDLPVKELKGTKKDLDGNAVKVDSVNLSEREIGYDSAVVIAALVRVNSSLTYLNLERNKLHEEGAADALIEGLSNLKLTRSTDNAMTRTAGLPILKVVNLLHNKLSNTAANKLAALGREKRIMVAGTMHDQQVLDLSGRELGHPDAILLACDMRISTCLTELKLASTGLDDAGAKEITEALNHEGNTLTMLGLLHNAFGCETAERLAAIAKEKRILLSGIGRDQSEAALDPDQGVLTPSDALLIASDMRIHTCLRSLRLLGKELSRESASTLANIGQERSIMLTGIKHNAREELRLRNQKLQPSDVVLLASDMRVSTCLTSLDLTRTRLNDESAEMIAAALDVSDTMRTARLLHNQFGSEAASKLAAIAKRKRIVIAGIEPNQTEAHLSQQQVAPTDAILISADLFSCAALSSLDLSQNQLCGLDDQGQGTFSTEGLQAIARSVCSIASLKELDLDTNLLGDDGVSALAEGLKASEGLESIVLSYNAVGPRGVQAVACWLLWPGCALKKLDLSNNKKLFKDSMDGIVALAEAVGITKTLRDLNLSATSLSTEGAKALAGAAAGKSAGKKGASTPDQGTGLAANRSLTSLSVNGNELGKEGTEALRKAWALVKERSKAKLVLSSSR